MTISDFRQPVVPLRCSAFFLAWIHCMQNNISIGGLGTAFLSKFIFILGAITGD